MEVCALPRSPCISPLLWCLGVLSLLHLLPNVAAEPAHFKKCQVANATGPWPEWLVSWPGGCLVSRPETTAEGCNQTCFEDVRCPGWHFTANKECRWATTNCKGSNVTDPISIDEAAKLSTGNGSLVLHGVLQTTKLAEGLEVQGLLNVGTLGGATEAEDVRRCSLLCHADTTCGYWQYGDGSCRLEIAPLEVDPFTNFTWNTPGSKLIVDGEEVARGCPHEPHPGWLIMGCVSLVLGSCAACWAVTGGEGPTRVDPEKPHALLLSLGLVRNPSSPDDGTSETETLSGNFE